METDYEVIVIGGGAAGLSAAVALGRSRRSVLVIDAGEPRNAPAAGVHNFLSREGTAPGALLEAGRAEVEQYGGQIRTARATGAEKLADDWFAVTLEDGARVTARRLVVTTGLVDELPELEGLRERWGRDVLHCPYCHGWEVRDQTIAVLGVGPGSLHQALLFSQLTDDLTLVTHDFDLDEDSRRMLGSAGVRVVEGRAACGREPRTTRSPASGSRTAAWSRPRRSPSRRTCGRAARCSPRSGSTPCRTPRAWASTS